MDKTLRKTLIYLIGTIQWALNAMLEQLDAGDDLQDPAKPLPPSESVDNGTDTGECSHPLDKRKPIPTGGNPNAWFCKVDGCGHVNEG